MIRSNLFRSALVLLVLLLGTHKFVQAQAGCVISGGSSGSGGCPSAPEIDPSLGASAAALLTGVVLVIRSRRRA
jgi:hypothetical protein